LLIGLAITFFLGWNVLHHHARAQAIDETPPTTIQEITNDPVKVEGEAVALGPLLSSPVTGTPCLYFKLVIEEERAIVENRHVSTAPGTQSRSLHQRNVRTHTRREWVTIVEDVQQAECGVKDDTGVAAVDLPDAEVTLLGKEPNLTGSVNQCPEEVKKRLADHYGLVMGGFVGVLFSKKTRYTESLLVPGDHLLVLGVGRVQPKRRPAIGQGKKTRLVVSNRTGAEMLRHHTGRKIGSAVGAVIAAVVTVILAGTVARSSKAPLPEAAALGQEGAPALAPGAAAPALAPAKATAAPAPGAVALASNLEPAPASTVAGSPRTAESPAAASPPANELPIDRDFREAHSTFPPTRTFALQRLRENYKAPVPERQAEVAAFLMENMNNGDFDSAQALYVWATPKELPEIAKFLGHRELSKPAMAILGHFQYASEAETIASFLRTSRKEAAESLTAMGPGAEAAVLPYVDEPDDGVKREACYVLQRIGTARSLPALDSLSEDPNKENAQSARLAARAIRQRLNLPETGTATNGSTGTPAQDASPSAEWAGWAGEWTILSQKKFQHGAGVRSIAYSPSGKLLVTADSGAVRIWDVAASQPHERGNLLQPKAAARDMLFLPNERTLILGMDDNSVRLLDVSRPKLAELQRI